MRTVTALLPLLLAGCAAADRLPRPPAGLPSDLGAAARATDSGRVAAGFVAVRTQLDSLHPEAAAELRPPADTGAAARAAAAGCELPEEVRWLYAQADGEAPARQRTVFWYLDWLPLDSALAERRRRLAGPEAAPWGWRPEWLPLFDFEGESHFVLCGAGRASPVYHYFLEDTETPLFFTSLATMLETQHAWTAAGAVRVVNRRSGQVATDLRRMQALHLERNPNAVFPYAVPDSSP